MQQAIRQIFILSLAVWAILLAVALAVAIAPVVVVAAFAYAGYAVLVLAYREIIPPGRERRNYDVLRNMLGCTTTDIISLPTATLAVVADAAVLVPTIPLAPTGWDSIDTSQEADIIADLVANLDASPEADALRRAAANAILTDDAPSMADTLRIANMPSDAFTLPELPCVAVLPTAPTEGESAPIPRKRAANTKPRKVTAVKPLPMPTAAQRTVEVLYVRRSGGRYSKVGGRITPREGEALYRYDDSARGGRGGYVEA